MKNPLALLLGIVVALVLLFYMFSFQVRYNEYAVVTHLGNATASSVKSDHGFHLRLPPPIQEVHKFPTQDLVLADTEYESQVQGGVTVATSLSMVWRISDPLAFFIKLQSVENANSRLATYLRDARSVFGQYSFDQFVNTDPARIKLDEIQQQMRATVQSRVDQQALGIEIKEIGISRLVLPQQVTPKVFERMKQSKLTLAQQARSEGDSEAQAITKKAESDSQIILAFADSRAKAIRAQGTAEAAPYLKAFEADPELASFLRRLDFYRKILPTRTTLILDAKDLGLQLPLRPTTPTPLAPPAP